ncbi:MAG: hypothetical protein SV253_04945 [Halobacteria archaeon]|nr:hypothetical protein [Halobacteria archaeon]
MKITPKKIAVAGLLVSALAVGLSVSGHVDTSDGSNSLSVLEFTDSDSVDEYQLQGFGEEEGEESEEESEEGVSLLPDWWGLGGEANEAPYIGLVEIGVTVLVVGVLGYSAGKRLSVVPSKYRRNLLRAHEWTMLAGTALTVPHFVFVEEWGGTGLLVGILLGVEVISGVYGRRIHRDVMRLGRGDETAEIVGRIRDISNKVVLSKWHTVHIWLTLATGVVLVVHIITAVAD